MKPVVNIKPTDRVAATEGVTAREFDGEWVLLDLKGGHYFGVDEIGGMIWRHLAAGETASDISVRLVRMYDVDESTALADVLRLEQALLERGLIAVV